MNSAGFENGSGDRKPLGVAPDFGRIDGQMATDELNISRMTAEIAIGPFGGLFCDPSVNQNWTPFAQDAARQAGYQLIYAQAENSRPQGTIPRTFVTSMDNDRIFRALLVGAFDN